ncbi:inositol polyphosphate 5-phosphatase [Actinomortierella wolfii]|nr:inositol polyphosphate 5-phosphatase [Actinomortierella wolfii]
MQAEVFVSYGSPRTIAIRPCMGWQDLDSTRVMYFSLHPQPDSRGLPQCSVRLEPSSDFEQSLYNKLYSRPIFGCLGLMHHGQDTFLVLVTSCSKVGDIRLGESVYRIGSVKFFSLTGNTPDDDLIPGQPYDSSYDSYEQEQINMIPHPCREFEKVLSSGTFYFSPQVDITRSIQSRSLQVQETKDAQANQDYDTNYLWNHFLLKELLSFRSHLDEQERQEMDLNGFLVHVIQGYVGCTSFRTATQPTQLTVISRLSSMRAGTRYNTRGIDDNGHVANFVETETILSNSEWCFAYTQIRGSVPVFWEQQGLQLMNHKIQLSRGTDATKPAVRRHFEELINKYQEVHIVDLLGIKDPGELTLSQEYKRQVETLAPVLKHLHMTKFDYHSQVKGGNYDQVQVLLRHVQNDSEKYGYFFHDLTNDTIVQTQKGVFRTNCLDCLDRTNVIQSNLSKGIIESLFFNLYSNERERLYSLMSQHSDLWAQNGDSLSKIYTGTGALKSEVTRSGKMSFASMIGDATKSINRFYINNFQDKDRQDVIDQLLGKMGGQYPVVVHDPIHETVTSEMRARRNEYLQKTQIDVFVGTYNLNGKVAGGESLEPWLKFKSDEVPEPDLYVIAFQEIVKLTPKQIMATDVSKREVWEREVEKTINQPGNTSRYVQLRSGQLVGAALMIYVKEENTPYIKNVECSIKKTGMGGMAGNKGAVAIRMDYFETTICFVTSHLASGQDNIDDRNNDFHTIDSGITFTRGRSILGHDIIIWCGDFNYRLDKDNDEIRALAIQGNYFELFKYDQLKRSIDYGEAFTGYREGIIAFAPTYRYDIGTDRYDTSEKYRAPAWTDRILYRGKGVYQTSYTRAELRKSDHRPVMSMFVLELDVLDVQVKEELERTLYRTNSSKTLLSNQGSVRSRKDTPLGIKAVMAAAGRDEGAKAIVTNQDALPKPSTDLHQWWNDPLDPNIKRIPSNHRNPFVNDHIRLITPKEPVGAVRPSLPPPSSNTTPSINKIPPTQQNTVSKKPVVDLLGDLDDSSKGLTVFDQNHGAAVKDTALPSTTRRPPAPPPSRRGIPASLAVGITGTKDTSLPRRPAPPPPQRKKMSDTDDDDDDDDSDNSSVSQQDTNGVQRSLTTSTSNAMSNSSSTTPITHKTSLSTTRQEQQQQQQQQSKLERPPPPPSRLLAPKDEKVDEDQEPAETLVKPSALKSGANKLYSLQKTAASQPSKQPGSTVVNDQDEHTPIRPKMTSSLVSAYEKNANAEPSRTPQPSAKIQIPRSEVTNGPADKKGPPAVPSKATKPTVNIPGGQTVGLASARSALAEMSPSVAAAPSKADEDDSTQPISVSQLAKTFAQDKNSGKPSVNTTNSTVAGAVAAAKKQLDTPSPIAASSKPLTSAPTIIKPASTPSKPSTLAKPASGLEALLENDRKHSEQQAPGSTHSSTALEERPISSSTTKTPKVTGVSKLRQQPLPGLAVSSETHKPIAPSTTKAASSQQRDTNKDDEERQDKLPENGSVKNAIAALTVANSSSSIGGTKTLASSTPTNSRVGSEVTKKGTDNSAGADDGSEDEKVDAFAFWKSK